MRRTFDLHPEYGCARDLIELTRNGFEILKIRKAGKKALVTYKKTIAPGSKIRENKLKC